MEQKSILVQGYPGCFHEEAARKYFGTDTLSIEPCDTFNILASKLHSQPNKYVAIMAIENSIAGTLLQNYRILRENHFRVIGEVYLRIRHNLMALPGQEMGKLKEVISHPMALNQCLSFLRKMPNVKLVESDDTALTAKRIREGKIKNVAAIASTVAADIYDLEVLARGIETSETNYTRFFIVQDATKELPLFNGVNKASIYVKLHHERGSLLKVLQVINNFDVNMSKLQSYPVLGEMMQYYFHIDIEFTDIEQYTLLIQDLNSATMLLEILGVYRKSIFYEN